MTYTFDVHVELPDKTLLLLDDARHVFASLDHHAHAHRNVSQARLVFDVAATRKRQVLVRHTTTMRDPIAMYVNCEVIIKTASQITQPSIGLIY